MAENYKHLYHQMKKMVQMYQDEIVPMMREQMNMITSERDAAIEDLSRRPHRSTCKHGEHCEYINAITGVPDCYKCDEWEWIGVRDKV